MQTQTKGRIVALLPLVVFLGIYLAGSLIVGDFYKIPITVAVYDYENHAMKYKL